MVKSKSANAELLTRWILAGILVLAVGTIWANWHAISKTDSSTSDGRLKVVAAENFWGNIASQIGGNKVDLSSIITDPNADPHLYESDAKDAITIAQAKVVFVNGLGYDDFMNRLLSASPSKRRTVVNISSVLGITGSEANPHLWYDTSKIPTVAAAMANSFAAQDPANKVYYMNKLQSFDASLKPIDDKLLDIKAKYGGDSVAYTERVPGYLLAQAGLINKTPEAFSMSVEDGVDPSPQATLQIEGLLSDHEVRALIYNAQTVSKVTEDVRALAKRNGIPIVAVTETMPPSDGSYQQWQLDQLDQLEGALAGD